ncbi:MAG: coproporphyrinogen III oxidase, partial [Rhodospirillales bacterium]|nr:coproporphyrinogen III oxidase [Rhodospirillales bacterium]
GAESRHNLAYWRYTDYAGIGPGAHGRVSVGGSLLATRRHRAPEPWAERVERSGHGTTEEVVVTPPQRAREALLMGLRLAEGIAPARFAARTGMPLTDALDAAMLAATIEAGYIEFDTNLRATEAGRRRLDALLGAIVR